MSNTKALFLCVAALLVRWAVFGNYQPEMMISVPWLVPALIGALSLFGQKKANDSAQRNAARAQQEAERRQWEEKQRKAAPRNALIAGLMKNYGLDKNEAFKGYFDRFTQPGTFTSQQPGFSSGSSLWPLLMGGAGGYLSWLQNKPPLPQLPSNTLPTPQDLSYLRPPG